MLKVCKPYWTITQEKLKMLTAPPHGPGFLPDELTNTDAMSTSIVGGVKTYTLYTREGKIVKHKQFEECL